MEIDGYRTEVSGVVRATQVGAAHALEKPGIEELVVAIPSNLTFAVCKSHADYCSVPRASRPDGRCMWVLDTRRCTYGAV